MAERSDLRIGIAGAGAIGCYVGGVLQSLGASVLFLGRARLQAELTTHGLRLSSLAAAADRVVAATDIRFVTEPSGLAGCNVVLVACKSAQTADIASSLSLAPGTVVISMQNGVRNPEVLRRALPSCRVLGGIVGFNVVSKGEGRFRQATTGPLVFEAEADARVDALSALLRRGGFALETPRDVVPLQWSKLVMNLNNAVSALSDRPTAELLFASDYRRILAAIMAEALGVLRASGTRTARLGALPPRVFPFLLRLPTPLLKVLARAQLKVDPEARSSMWEDLAQRRLTEVDYLNGEIVRLAARANMAAPLNARIVSLVHEVEQAKTGSPKLSAPALREALGI